LTQLQPGGDAKYDRDNPLEADLVVVDESSMIDLIRPAWIVNLVGIGGRQGMGEVAYRSKVSIEREKGPLRWARLPAERDPILFGVHSEVAEHYGVTPDASPPHATTLDYIVAAAAG
jgi:hypothetical protein